MNAHWHYLKYVLRHKWFVLIWCCRYGIPWAGIVHDLSKLRPREWITYVDYFYGGPWPKENSPGVKYAIGDMFTQGWVEERFDAAWNHHQKANPHHWQYWLVYDIIIGTQLAANDKERKLCRCLIQANSNEKNTKSAQDVDKTYPARNLTTGGNIGVTANDATPTLPGNTERNTQTISSGGTGSATPRTQKSTDNAKRTFWYATVARFLSIMVDHLQSVPVAGKLTMSFLHWIISTGGGEQHRKQHKLLPGLKTYRWAIKNGFPPIFRVLCHNCNSAYGIYGYCPHQQD